MAGRLSLADGGEEITQSVGHLNVNRLGFIFCVSLSNTELLFRLNNSYLINMNVRFSINLYLICKSI